MIKHDYSEEEIISMRLKLLKLGFLSNLSKLEPSSCHDVRWSRCDVGDEPRKRHDVWVPTSRCGAYEAQVTLQCLGLHVAMTQSFVLPKQPTSQREFLTSQCKDPQFGFLLFFSYLQFHYFEESSLV